MMERESADYQQTPRAEEQDDVAEPDAPTAQTENEGMSTVLDADQPLGVQDDASQR